MVRVVGKEGAFGGGDRGVNEINFEIYIHPSCEIEDFVEPHHT